MGVLATTLIWVLQDSEIDPLELPDGLKTYSRQMAGEEAVSLTADRAKITSVEQWSDTREEFEASTYIRRPLGTIRVAAAGTFRIVASVLPAATYPTVISEAVARLFSYREAYKPRRNTGELADGTPPSTTGSFLRSGAAECLRFIRTPGI